MRLHRCAPLLGLLFALSAFGQFTYVTPQGEQETLEADFASAEVNVIVELREAPAFVAKSAGTRSIETRLDALERDVRRIHDGIRPVAANAKTIQPRMRARFTRVYAGASLRVDRQSLAAIRALPYVKRVHYEREVRTHLAASVPQIGAPAVWARTGLRGRGITVAVIDTGIDYRHAAFGGGFGPGARVAGGYDTVNNDADPLDDNGHGTHVAAIIGANGGGLTGVAPEVTFLAYKALNAGGGGSDTSIIAAVERAVDPNRDGDPSDRADVINMSLGRISGSADDPITAAVENASRSGALFVISSGNSGGFYQMSAPADAPSALAVGASDRNDALADFTSKGPAAGTFALKPEIVAPGVDILSARAGGTSVKASGTSMAAPHVAGAAALLRALHPSWTAAQIKSALVSSAVVLGNDVMAEGAGRLDVDRAARVDVTMAPAVLGFGRDDGELAEWTTSQDVTLVNHAAGPVTLTGSAAPAREGIVLTIEPASVTLAAGESRTVRVTLKVTNALVPGPRVGSLAYYGQVVFSGGAQELHLPWAFVKAARLVVRAQNDEPYSVLVAGNGRIVSTGIVEPGRRVFEAVVPAGEYDVLARPLPMQPGDNRIRYVFAEKQQVESSLEVPMQFDTTLHRFDLAASGPDGIPLRQRDRVCTNTLTVVFPDSDDNTWSSISTPDVNVLQLSNLSERFQLVPVQWCLSMLERNGNDLFIAQHPIRRGMSGAVTSAIEEGQWRSTALQIDIPAGTPSPWVRIGAAALVWRTVKYGVSASQHRHWRFDDRRWSGTLHMTPDRHPRIGAAAVMQVAAGNLEGPPGRELPSPVSALSADLIRLVDGGFTVYRTPLDVTPSPALYIDRTASLRLGDAPRWPSAFVGEIGLEFFAGMRVFGPRGEDRMHESLSVEAIVRDRAGNVIDLPRDRIGSLPRPDAYTVEMNLPATATDGALRVRAALDTRKADGMPPVLTSFRIVDAAGGATSRLEPGANGALVFSALELINGLGVPTTSAVLTAELSWRAHGTAPWQPLTVTKTGEDIGTREELQHDPAGALYRADLSSVSRTAGGFVDLRVVLTDPAGNTMSFEGDRSLFIGAARRRTSGVR